MSFRVSRWPPQKVIAQELDQMQAAMIASILRRRPLPGEGLAIFFRRRMRDAHVIARSQGTRSSKWFRRFEKWNEHLDRHPEHASSHVMATRASPWLQARRAVFAASSSIRTNSWTSLAGRTDTRNHRGFVAQRWESGREFGRIHL